MVLTFDPTAGSFALCFSVFVIVMLFVMGARFLRRTNIIDVVNESHKTEPIREVKAWYGTVGIVLMIVGGLLGYLAPDVLRPGAAMVSAVYRERHLLYPAVYRTVSAFAAHGGQWLATGKEPI